MEPREALGGPVLALVNNAGVRADGLALSLTDEDWRVVLDTNLGATYRLTRAALREMIRARFGRVINIASVVGPARERRPGQLRGVQGGGDRLHEDRGGRGRAARRDDQRRRSRADRDRHDRRRPRQRCASGFRRSARARREEVAAAVAFLASDAAGYITASTLYVDGGLSA